MGFDDFETLELIEAVKKNPILYDTSLPDYKNIQLKRKLWQQFADDLGAKNGEVILTKWKQLRDNYAKHKKKYTSDTHPYKQWRWAPYMTFMDPHLRKPRNIMASESSEPDDSEEISQSEEPIVNTNSPQVCVFKTNYPVRKKMYIDTPGRSAVGENANEKLDMTDYLFLNYAQTFKKLSPRSQVMLKLEVAKIFAEAEIGEIDGDENESFKYILKVEPGDDDSD